MRLQLRRGERAADGVFRTLRPWGVALIRGATLIRGRCRVEPRPPPGVVQLGHITAVGFTRGSEVPLLEGSAVVGRKGQLDLAATLVHPRDLDPRGSCVGASVRPVAGRRLEESVGSNPAQRVRVLEVIVDDAPRGAVHRVCVCLIVAVTVRPTMLAGAIILSGGVGLVGPPSSQPVATARHTPASNDLAARSSNMDYLAQRGDRDGVVFRSVTNLAKSSLV